MKFLHPQLLWLLLSVPVLVAAYVMMLRRQKKHALRYASISLIKEAIGPRQRLRRHIPPLLFLLSEIVLIVACAAPTAVVTLPSQRKTVVLAMDVSLSMGARDVDPNRITAAQSAAKTFVEDRPDDVDIGIVAFGATASLVQPPTRNRDDLLAAIDRFELQRGTATGSALYVALHWASPIHHGRLYTAPEHRPDAKLRGARHQCCKRRRIRERPCLLLSRSRQR